MHHYGLHTAPTLAYQAELQPLWQYQIPEEAIQYPFLMQGLLAISALHLTHLRPDEYGDWLPLSFKYQSMALASFRATLPNLNERNCHALFAASALISATSLSLVGQSSNHTTPGSEAPILLKDLISPFILIRGNARLTGMSMKWIRKGRYARFLLGHHVTNITGYEDSLSSSASQHFTDMLTMLQTMSLSTPEHTVFQETIRSLKMIYMEITCAQRDPEVNKHPGILLKWPMIVSQDFISHLQEFHPAALIIFAHFAVLATTFQDWYLKGWPERVVLAISKALPLGWKKWMYWPEKQLKDGICIFD